MSKSEGGWGDGGMKTAAMRGVSVARRLEHGEALVCVVLRKCRTRELGVL